jgi:hypothetical protein
MLLDLVLAECVEGTGRLLDEIVNGIWTTCEETYWGLPAHLGLQKAGSGLPDVEEPTVDLFAAETASLLAWTSYLFGAQLDKVSPLVRERIHAEIQRRVLEPNLRRIDFWWMGLDPDVTRRMNNWNPWINSNWLTCALLEERDEKRRTAAVHKSVRSLDRFLDSYHDDGGCDEGPSYWFHAGGSLFDCLELLHSASGGAIDVYDIPLVKEIGRYIYRAHIYDDWVVNFADASAKVELSGDLIYRYGRRIGDARMQSLGAWAAARAESPGTSGSIARRMYALFNAGEIAKPPRAQPLVRDVWLPGTGIMAARIQEGSPRGLYLAAQAGHNAESHNHNDVGNFIVFADGKPAIIDVGVETYSAKTFSSRRYEIWTMQSAYHNVPTIGAVMQAAGREFEATGAEYRSGDTAAEFSLDIAKAYPAEAGLKSWRRRLRLDRARNELEIRDTYSMTKPAPHISLTLMTPANVATSTAGTLDLGLVRVHYDAAALTPRIEEIKIDDARLLRTWGERLHRILLVADRPPATGEFIVRIAG